MDKKAPIVLLRFRYDMPQGLKLALYDFGFNLRSMKSGKWVIFAKESSPKKKEKEVLGAPWETTLENRLNKIIDAYLDPYSHLGAIKSQIIQLSKTLPKEQGKWCTDWLDKNLDAEFFTPPWENPNHEPNLGAC